MHLRHFGVAMWFGPNLMFATMKLQGSVLSAGRTTGSKARGRTALESFFPSLLEFRVLGAVGEAVRRAN